MSEVFIAAFIIMVCLLAILFGFKALQLESDNEVLRKQLKKHKPLRDKKTGRFISRER